jgi:hypothetical protein
MQRGSDGTLRTSAITAVAWAGYLILGTLLSDGDWRVLSLAYPVLVGLALVLHLLLRRRSGPIGWTAGLPPVVALLVGIAPAGSSLYAFVLAIASGWVGLLFLCLPGRGEVDRPGQGRGLALGVSILTGFTALGAATVTVGYAFPASLALLALGGVVLGVSGLLIFFPSPRRRRDLAS